MIHTETVMRLRGLAQYARWRVPFDHGIRGASTKKERTVRIQLNNLVWAGGGGRTIALAA